MEFIWLFVEVLVGFWWSQYISIEADWTDALFHCLIGSFFDWDIRPCTIDGLHDFIGWLIDAWSVLDSLILWLAGWLNEKLLTWQLQNT